MYNHIRVYEYGEVSIVSTKEENRLIGVLSKIGLVRYTDETLTAEERSEIDNELSTKIGTDNNNINYKERVQK